MITRYSRLSSIDGYTSDPLFHMGPLFFSRIVNLP